MTAVLNTSKSGNVETCDGTSADDDATHVVLELLAEEEQRVASERFLREGRAAVDKNREKKLLFENVGVGVVQLELSNQQVPCEDFAAQLEMREIILKKERLVWIRGGR